MLNWKDIKNPTAGGAEIIAFFLARNLVRDGHKVIFFSKMFKSAFPEETIDGVRIVRRGNSFSVYLHAYLFYRKLREKPDKVVDMINTICWQTPLYVPLGKRIAFINQLAKEVWFYEQPYPLSFIGYILERLEYLSYKNTPFICYSESTKRDIIPFGIEEKKIHMFPLGVDHTRYKKGAKKATYPLFVFIARLVKMKRADICIQAMASIVKMYPQAKLAIIGNGRDEKRLVNLTKSLSLDKNIIFVNKENFYIDKNELDKKVSFMQKAWAILLPSVKEGWGMVITEAASCGTPAIVSNVTGLRDSVLHNKTGIILSCDPTPQELSNAMLTIIKDVGFRNRLGKGATLWSKKFSWESSYEAFKKLL